MSNPNGTRPGTATLRTTPIGQTQWFASGTPEQRRRYVDAVVKARETVRRNRGLLLAQPDLRDALVSRLGYERPDQWSGYVPPRFYEHGGAVGAARWLPNESPRRAVQLELLTEAEARQGGKP